MRNILVMQNLSPNEQLNIVLSAFSNKLPVHVQGTVVLPNGFLIDNRDLQQAVDKLVRDKYLEIIPDQNNVDYYYRITFEGSVFLNNGGYIGEENRSAKFEKIIESIPDLTKVTSYILTIAVIFGISQHLVFYQLMLRVPIFNFVGVSEFILSGGNRTIPIAIFLAINYASLTLTYSKKNKSNYRYIGSFALIALGVGVIKLAGYFDPLLGFTLNLPLSSIYYLCGLAIFLIALVAFMLIKEVNLKELIDQNWIVFIVGLTLWYGLYFGFGNFAYLQAGAPDQNVIVKLKSGILLNKSTKFIFAGRTEKYWFFYNTERNYTRIIKEDDIETSEFK